MKKLISALFLCFVVFNASAQWSNKSFVFNSLNRQYRVYVPAIYNTSNPASLVLTLHGLGDNMTNFSGIGMNFIADTANIVVVVPQAIADPFAGTAWNSGAGASGYYPNAGVNDVAFLNALIDTIMNNYAINSQRIYCCGFSMGAFMTQRLGCELTGKFSAIASVAGTFGSGIASCTPQKQIPVAHFHGTADGTVGYTVNNYGIKADSLINFWVGHNQCATTPTTFTFPDIASDGFTVDHFLYTSTQTNDVELFKVNGAGHIWLTPSNDIFYTTEIWKFFNKHKVNSVGLNESSFTETNLSVYPNPAQSSLTVEMNSSFSSVKVMNVLGAVVMEEKCDGAKVTLNIENLQAGIYFVSVCENGRMTAPRKIIRE